MTDVVVSSEDVIVTVQQPTLPPSAPPPKIGLVEINQVVQRGSAWMTGSGPPTLAGGQYGDMYLDVDTGDIYLWDGTTWTFQGTFAPSTLTPAEILAALITVDGPGSLLDADFLDGHDSPYFATQAGLDANSGRDDTQDTTLTSHSNSINANVIAINDLTTANTAQDTAINGKVAKAGDTMTGPLTVVTPPTQPAYAASKAYVDAQTGAITVVPPATVPPLMDGAAAVGTTTKYAREDHRHPSDTAKIGDAPNDGVQYVRQSLAWSPVNVPPGTVVSDTAPSSPQSGQMWLKSSTMVLYCWYVDPNTAQWIQVSASPQTVDQNYSRKTARRANLAINGALNVSQENGNSAGTTNLYYAADQFYNVAVTAAPISVQRVQVVTPNGSPNRFRMATTGAGASVLNNYVAAFATAIEGLNVTDLQWGTAQAMQAVLRFGWKSPAGTYSIGVENGAQTRSYVASFTIAAGQANTDTVQTFVIPGDTTGTWTTDNTAGIRIFVAMVVGTDRQGVAGWQAGEKTGTSSNSNGFVVSGNVFEIFDIYFGADPDKTGLAPTFEVPDYQTELAKCQRYWHQTQAGFFCGNTTISTAYYATAKFSVIPRTTPTFSAVNSTAGGFPTAPGTFTYLTDAVTEGRTASAATAGGVFRSSITVNARM